MLKSNYHSLFLKSIKLAIGASYVSYEENKGSFGLKVIKDGRKKLFPLVGRPEHVSPDSYQQLGETLKAFDFNSEDFNYKA